MRYTLTQGLYSLAMFFAVVAVAYGATENFNVNSFVGGDSTPPSTPANLVATPIATSQIDLDWDDATDNVSLTGYHVYRDGVRVATTSGSIYQDTGLTASTTYVYYVTAFDWLFNVSASSTNATATTLSVPAAATSTPSGLIFGSRLREFERQIIQLEILPQKDSVLIRYETEDHIRSVVRWGKTTSYETGSLGEEALIRRHETRITGLMPGTTYHFTIEGENRYERRGTMHVGTFRTLPSEDIFPPGNVTGLVATKEGSDVLLSWKNPGDNDFNKVRVMRSDLFYPTDAADGWLVYEGEKELARDTGGGDSAGWQYYTIFTYDHLGNVSSGAVVSIYVGDAATVPEDVTVVDPTQNSIALSFEDIVFTQEGDEISHYGGTIRVDGSKQLTISIPYERLPEHLKTILVTFTDGDKTLKFLLRANREKTFYTGTLAPFGRNATFPVQVAVFDFKTAQVGYADGTVLSRIQSPAAAPAGFLDVLSALALNYWYLVWFLIFLFLIMFFGFRIVRRDW